ncbi:MAG: hypothetical protein IKO06_01140 [Alphaproteobacteria bacterium]|nr:hypothetical protein [Alphaproteobacteria bacterium]
MKKIFIPAFVLIIGACGLFDRSSSNYFLNHMHNYTVYPVTHYSGDDFDFSEKETSSEEIITHTYQRNIEVSANVGQRMVDSESVNIKKLNKQTIAAQSDGVITNTVEEIHIKKGQEFTPLGEVEIDGIKYILIDADNKGGILLVNESGNIVNKVNYLYKGDLLYSKGFATVYPENLTIKQTNLNRTEVSNKKQNFEIIYNGSKDGFFDLMYIDYENSDKGEAKKYTYMKNAKYIDVNGVKLEITGVYPDRIEYKILD